MNINLHIDRLILDNVNLPHHQIKEFKAAVELALKHQLESHGAELNKVSNQNYLSLKGGSITIHSTDNAARLGQQTGYAIYRGFG